MMFAADKWMKFEIETIYGDKRICLYDSIIYDSEDKVLKAVELADMHLNTLYQEGMIVLDEFTANFWFSIIDEVKEKALNTAKGKDKTDE